MNRQRGKAKMGVGSERTKIADLMFQVYGRALHPEWLPQRAHRRITRSNWEADLRLADGAQAIVWSSGDVRLTEVLCPSDFVLPDTGCLFRSNVRYERSATLHPAPGIEYQTCFESERVEPEVFMHLYAELTLDADRGGMLVRECPTNRLVTPRISHMTFEATPRGLAVQSVHAFPDERAIVRVQSLFERSKG